MEKTRDIVYLAALAGLLHDVGKFAQRKQEESRLKHTQAGEALLADRVGLLAHLVPPGWQDDIGDVVKYHHGSDTHKDIVKQVQLADWIAASERQTAPQDQGQAAATPLIPIMAEVTLQPADPPAGGKPGGGWGYSLRIGAEGIPFPRLNAQVSSKEYQALWEQHFEPLVRAFPGPLNTYSRMAGWLDVLADTLSAVPSATPWEKEEDERTTPDVPLYHHLHLTAALAVCLQGVLPDDCKVLYQAGQQRQLAGTTIPVARLVKLDFSGIQDFIYCITSPKDEQAFRKTAKRLRGRSLHIALLNRAIGDWVLQDLGLPPTQLMYAGGGVVELLLPPDGKTETHFQATMQTLQEALWNEFGGALGVVYADVLLKPGDFANMQAARETLEDRLAHRKTHKWEGQGQLFAVKPVFHVCAVCGLTVMEEENQICLQCQIHERIGDALPRARALVSVPTALSSLPGAVAPLPRPLQGTLALVGETQIREALQATHTACLRGLNDFTALPSGAAWGNGSAPGRWSIANAAPQQEGELYDFEEIAALSRGTPYLGVLKADADRMGLIFSRGLHPNTFSRAMVLSQAIGRFFGEYLNALAQEVTVQWSATLTPEGQAKLKGLDNVFYVLYAGGDDLFVIGPWDALIEFAFALRRQYRAYTCENDLFGLSAGLVLVKPHFPIQQFSRLADEAEHEAKSKGRDALTLFGQTRSWTDMEMLVTLGKNWAQAVTRKEKPMPRGLLHDLGRLSGAQGQGYAFNPQVYYTLSRRLSGWGREEVMALGQQVLQNLVDAKIKIPVTYASLITRKE